jgi:hypothetical protein
MTVFWVVAPQSGRSLPMFQRYLLPALMMEAASTYETLVNFYQTTQCYNPEDSHLHTCHRENLQNLKSYKDLAFRNMQQVRLLY